MAKTATRMGNGFVEGAASSDPAGMRDFWQVYEANYDDISDEATVGLVEDPEFGPILQGMSEEQTKAQNRESREMLSRAILSDEWEDYVAYLRAQGATYAQMGISFGGWFRVLNVIRPPLTRRLFEAYVGTPDRLRAALDAMDRFIDLAMALIGEEYLKAKEQIIEDQQVAIRELSTPVLQIRDGLLLLPAVGMIDSNRARQMTDQLLHAIRAHRAKVVVIDITGVPAVDSMVANHLVQVVEAARLLGARALLTGLSADVAQTIVRIGVDLSAIRTTGSLQDGIVEADRLQGLHTTQRPPEAVPHGEG
jgi:rsbT co-antagonist protein RsbR